MDSLSSVSLNESNYFDAGTQDSQNIYIVRHGESELNVRKADGYYLVSGQSKEISLTQKGEAQAKAMGLQLRQKIQAGAEVVICSSTAQRAKKTAELIFKELSGSFKCEQGLAYEGLIELGHGVWEGKRKDALWEKEISAWQALPASEKLVVPKVNSGESFQGVSQRALPDLQNIVDQHKGKIIIVVMHNAAMQALQVHWKGWSPVNLSKAPTSPLPVTEFRNCDLLRAKIEGKVHARAELLHIQNHQKV